MGMASGWSCWTTWKAGPMGEDRTSAEALPGVDRRSRESPVLFTAEFDGERFAVRRSVDGGTDYEWLTGPDQGWATSESPDRPHDAHFAELRDSLRDFAARGGSPGR